MAITKVMVRERESAIPIPALESALPALKGTLEPLAGIADHSARNGFVPCVQHSKCCRLIIGKILTCVSCLTRSSAH